MTAEEIEKHNKDLQEKEAQEEEQRQWTSYWQDQMAAEKARERYHSQPKEVWEYHHEPRGPDRYFDVINN